MDNSKKFGRVVLVGRPNTGKSTLLNALMNQKVAITSPLPQTTRKSNQVILNNENGTIIFTDTPGIINKVDDLMGKIVNTEAPKAVARKEIILCIVDISRPKSEEENKVIGMVRKMPSKKILVYNKIDKAVGTKDHLADYRYLEEEFDKVIAVSAIKQKYVEGLLDLIWEMLPLVTEDKIEEEIGGRVEENKPVIGMGSKEYVAEVIREKVYLFLRREIPYTTNVVVNSIKEKKKVIVVEADIYTNADRYKKMIIGAGGKKIKEIGYNARKELELMSGKQIYLELTVKTDTHWMEREKN